MITKKEFEKIKESISNFKYHSMEYTEFEDVAKHDIICNDDNLILIYGYNEQSSLYQYNYAFNDHKDFVKALYNCKKDDLLTFVNKEWVEDLRRIGFDIYAIWCSYFAHDLNKYKNDTPIEFVAKNEYKEASEVTLSCRYQSRGFSGQSEEWIQQWVDNKVVDYTKDCNIIVKKINGIIAGVVCVGVYGHESAKGPILWVREVAVRPEFQKKGIGRELLGQAFAYGLEKGATRSFLAADECNHGAIHLYKSMGYQADENDREINMIHN